MGSGPSSSVTSGTKSAGKLARPRDRSSSAIPTTRRLSASSITASRSRVGSLDEMGCGIAPSFQTAHVDR